MSARNFDEEDDTVSLGELLAALVTRWKSILAIAALSGLLGFGVASLIQPVFTARTLIIPQRQKETATASTLSSLATLAGAPATSLDNPADEYVSLMKSVTVADRIIDRFRLAAVYGQTYREEVRKSLASNVLINVGLTNGMITVEVDDTSAARAADIANAYVEGLRFMTNHLALSEAQQRRQFFEVLLQDARDRLAQAQAALQLSGYSADALQATPGQAAGRYAQVQAQAATAEIRLRSLRSTRAETAIEIVQQQAVLDALRAELSKLETRQGAGAAPRGSDFISKYREFKYRETLFDLVARQFESARSDEAREGALIQVVDAAVAPERKSKPKRVLIALGAALAGLLVSGLYVLTRVHAPPHRP